MRLKEIVRHSADSVTRAEAQVTDLADRGVGRA